MAFRRQKRLLYIGGLLALSSALTGCGGGGGISNLLPGGDKEAKANPAEVAQPSAAEQDRILDELQALRAEQQRRTGQIDNTISDPPTELAATQGAGEASQLPATQTPTQALPENLSAQDRVLAEVKQRQAQAQTAVPTSEVDQLQAQAPQEQSQLGLPASEVAQLQNQPSAAQLQAEAAQAQVAQAEEAQNQPNSAELQAEVAQLQAQAAQSQPQTSSFLQNGPIPDDQAVTAALVENEAVYRNVDACLKRPSGDFRNLFDGRPDLTKIVDEKKNQVYQNSDRSLLILTTDENCDISFTGSDVDKYSDGLIHILKTQGGVVENKKIAGINIISVAHPRGSFRLASGKKVIGQGGSTNLYTTIKAL